MMTLWTALAAFFLALARADDHIVLPAPGSSTELPTKMMIFIPGGKVPNDHYVATAKAIQHASSHAMNLWVVIPAVFQRLCIISCSATAVCSPLHSDVEAALTLAAAQGWVRGDDRTDVYLAGHSLGGVCANTLMQAYSFPYAALLVFGSYVDETGANSLTEYKTPVLTLNVELDGGLARPGKTSIWWEQFLGLSATDATNALLDKPVVVLPGLNHSDFCPGFDVPGDLPAEVSQQEATTTIGQAVAAFLSIQAARAAPQDADVSLLKKATEWTGTLLNPYLHATTMTADTESGHSAVCAAAQVMVAQLPAAAPPLVVNDTFEAEAANLEHCHTKYTNSTEGLLLQTCSHTDYYVDIDNTGSIAASKQVACKLTSGNAVQLALGQAVLPELGCRELNIANAKLAYSLAPKNTLARYQAHGKPLCFEADKGVPGNIGPLWVFSSSVSLTENATCLAISSPKLLTAPDSKIYPGNLYCKLLSPERVLDWMMTDSLQPSS